MGLIYKEESYRIIGACMAVHHELGCGFLEPVYQEALALELTWQQIPFEREKLLLISYKGQLLKKRYVADFICFETILLELKALDALMSQHEAQVINYLKASGFKLGLLVNFGTDRLAYKRLVRNITR